MLHERRPHLHARWLEGCHDVPSSTANCARGDSPEASQCLRRPFRPARRSGRKVQPVPRPHPGRPEAPTCRRLDHDATPALATADAAEGKKIRTACPYLDSARGASAKSRNRSPAPSSSGAWRDRAAHLGLLRQRLLLGPWPPRHPTIPSRARFTPRSRLTGSWWLVPSKLDAMLRSRWVNDGAVAQDDVRRPERQVVQNGHHDGEECVGVRPVGVDGDLAASVLVPVELADISLLDHLGQEGPGLADSLPLGWIAEAGISQSVVSDDGLLNVVSCFVCVGRTGNALIPDGHPRRPGPAGRGDLNLLHRHVCSTVALRQHEIRDRDRIPSNGRFA